MLLRSLAIACALGAPTIGLAQDRDAITASFVGAEGQRVGTARLTQMTGGVLIALQVSGLPAGTHAFHIHATGKCDPASGFSTAGGHFAGSGQTHGYKSPKGPHDGDMPNLMVGADGAVRLEVFNPNVSLEAGPTNLLDADGSAIVIHASGDDYLSQPSGNAGDRLACAVISR